MFSISKCQCCFFKFPNFHKIKCSRLGFHLGARKSKVATKTISCESYREILFQKVASGYLLHFVQDGSSKKRTRIIWGSLLNYRHPGHGAWEGGLRPAAPDSTSPEKRGLRRMNSKSRILYMFLQQKLLRPHYCAMCFWLFHTPLI